MPSSRIPYVRVAVNMPRHPKLEALPRSARWLLVELWCYCHENKTNGNVTAAGWNARGTKTERTALLAEGWASQQPDGSYEMHDYLDYQQSAEEIDALSSKRSAAGKHGAQVKASKKAASGEASASALAKQESSNPQAELRTSPASLEAGSPTGKRAAKATPVPDEFPITAAMAEWGRANAPLITDPHRETAKFLDHHRSNGKSFKDWTAAWRTWMANAQGYAEQRGGMRVVVDQSDLPESLRFG